MRRFTDGENCFGDVMPEDSSIATVNIRPKRPSDKHLQLKNYELIPKEKVLHTKTMHICATPTNAEVTATYVSVPPSSVVYVHITAVWGLSGGSGAMEASGGTILYSNTFVGSANNVCQNAVGVIEGTGLSAIGGDAVTIVCCSQNYDADSTLYKGVAPVVINGIANQTITWGLVIDTTTLYLEHV